MSKRIKKDNKISDFYSKMIIDDTYRVKIDNQERTISGAEFIKMVTKGVLMKQNGSTVSMLREMRQSIQDQKPQDNPFAGLSEEDYKHIISDGE